MSSQNRVTRLLRDEHRATIVLMERLEKMIMRHRRSGAPDVNDQLVVQFLSDLSAGIKGEIDRHFAFEENFLFTYLEDLGDGMIGAHLSGEHGAMRPLGDQIDRLARDAMARGFNESTWLQFRTIGEELCERMLTHVQKEEMALLPLLEEMMDASTETRLLNEYLQTA